LRTSHYNAIIFIGLIGLAGVLLFGGCAPKSLVEQPVQEQPAPTIEQTPQVPAEAQLDPKQLARAKLEEGNKNMNLGEWDKARANFEAAVNNDSTLADAHIGLSKVLMRAGEFSLAADHLKTAMNLKPEREAELRPLYYENLQRAGKPTDILNSVNQELTKDPNNPYALYRKAVLLLDLGQTNEVKKIARSIIKNKNDFAPAYIVLARSYWKEGNLDMARMIMEVASKWDPKSAQILSDLGALNYLSGNVGEAKKLFTRAVSQDSKNAYAHNNLGVVLLSEAREKDALAEFDQAIAVNPALAEAYLNRAEAKHRLDNIDSALQDVLVVQKLNPKMPEVYLLLGVLQEAKGLKDLAKANYQRYWSMAPPTGKDERVLRWIQTIESGASSSKGGEKK